MGGGFHTERDTPSAEKSPPGNHNHPGTLGHPGSLFRPGTGPDSNTGTNGSTDAHAYGNPGTHGVTGGETHCRKGGDAGQFFDPRTNSGSGAPRSTGSPPVAGLRGNALRTIRRRIGVYRR